jgi:hypothetical protein
MKENMISTKESSMMRNRRCSPGRINTCEGKRGAVWAEENNTMLTGAYFVNSHPGSMLRQDASWERRELGLGATVRSEEGASMQDGLQLARWRFV